MISPRATPYETAAQLLFGVGLLLVLGLKLLPALIAGLLIHSLVNGLVRNLRLPMRGRSTPRLLAVGLIAAMLVALLMLAGLKLAAFLRDSNENLPALIQRMAEIVEHSRDRLPAWLLSYVPADTEELRRTVVEWLRSHADTFQMAGAGLGRGIAHVVVGMVIGALLSVQAEKTARSHAPLSAALAHRGVRLALAFRRVVFAQFWISGINSLLTAFYLKMVLPLFGVHLPFAKTLILITFVAGLVPILGNLISNTVIFVVSLSQSLFVALGSLLYLVVIHKLEYFLNARIVGGHIHARAWELLMAMLLLESAFGIPGLVAAPIFYAYLKDELRARALI